MERKWIIAIVVIVIILVGGLGWYYFFGTSAPQKKAEPMLYVDGAFYNTTSITWPLNATPGEPFYSVHNVTNNGNATNIHFSYIALFYNSSQSKWVQIFNGTKWLINPASLVIKPHDAIKPLKIPAYKTNENSNYIAYINYTDQQISIRFQYLGNNPTVDNQTVFTYLGFSNQTGDRLETSNRAFNFTNNPNRANVNMLQVYMPENTTTWNATAIGTYSWNGTTPPSNAPVSVTITSDRKNVTWTIPYGAIGAVKGNAVGVLIQAFSHNFYPTGTTTTMPGQYYKLSLALPVPGTPFTVSLVSTSGTVPPFYLLQNRNNEITLCAVYINYTDQQISIRFQYLGNNPTVDNQTVFTYLGFSNATSGHLETSNRAFNFTNNPNRANASMLQVYEPTNTTTWNTTPIGTYSWNGTTPPSNAPVSVTITSDRKNVTWTIPYGAIGAVKDKTMGVLIQAFSHNFYPTSTTTTTLPTPNKYYGLTLSLPTVSSFKFPVQTETTVRFYFKVIFSVNATAGTEYNFNFNATIPS